MLKKQTYLNSNSSRACRPRVWVLVSIFLVTFFVRNFLPTILKTFSKTLENTLKQPFYNTILDLINTIYNKKRNFI